MPPLSLKQLDWNTVKAGLHKFLPMMKAVAAMTPTPVDDQVVVFLEALVAENSDAIALIPLPSNAHH